jgi:hypothetical protein
MSTIIDIDGVPTAVVSRGNNKPFIILYTIQPPPYSHHKQYQLVMEGPHLVPKVHGPVDNSDDTYIDNAFLQSVCILVFVLLCAFAGCISLVVVTH